MMAFLEKRKEAGVRDAAVLVAFLLLCSSASARSFGGGGYDGYDGAGAAAQVGYPAAINLAATNVTPANACLNGMLVSTGTAATIAIAFWGPTDGGTNKGNWTNTANFDVCAENVTLSTNVGVNPNTTYYYRFYASNTVGEGWAGSSASILTPGPPVLTTGIGAAPVSITTARLNGELMAGGTAAVTICYGTDSNNWTRTNTLGTLSLGAFNLTVTNLQPGTVYYYRVYGTNAYGESWSAVDGFTTTVAFAMFYGGNYDGYDRMETRGSLGAPSVVALAATNVTSSSAWLNGMLLSTGAASTEVMVYWGPTNGETNKGLWTNSANLGVSAENVTLTTNVGLSPGTVCWYRFYATNLVGYDAWAPSSLCFTSPSPPVVSTSIGAAPVSITTARLNGDFTLGGTAAITIYWGPDSNTWAQTNGLGTRSQGTYSLSVTNLAPGSVYYYRCYGTNIDGEGWSTVARFTTTVAFAIFYGGPYDGYGQYTESMTPEAKAQGTVFTLY